MTKAFKSTTQLSDFERLVATKMALDIRYFCSSNSSNKPEATEQCLKPVTKLPQALADMVTVSGIGSVVLFTENLATTKQIIQLTHDLQKAAVQSPSGQPLIISIDQEGGRVVRLPHATSFAGNMAIGATYVDHSVTFASQTSTVIAKELSALGINNNYAPVVDVNTNAANPVINTRSFGENPQRVAELGVAAVNGFQQNGVMATLKHFPGHGDTHVDSHLGLPLVAHDLATIEKQDLAPFQWAIKHSSPAMIMTAHIQYPALDDSTVVNNAGEYIVRPATMSRKILTDLLREKMGFEGIIATDALDMAGITHYFDKVTAVVETFVAGADLAVMPFKIRKVEDIDKFYQFIKDVAQRLKQKSHNNKLLSAELTQSIARINHYKAQYCQLPKTSVAKQITLAEQLIAQPEHLSLEQSLANNAVVQLTAKQSILPVNVAEINRIHLFVLNWQEFGALKHAIINQWQSVGKVVPEVSATVVAQGDTQAQLQSGEKLAKADLVIATVDTKVASAITSVVDTGGVEDLLTQITSMENKQYKVGYGLLLSSQLQQAQKQKVPSVLIAKGSPYLLHPYIDLAGTILVTFDDHIYQHRDEQSNKEQAHSSGYTTSMAIISGKQKALGILPVSLK
ncbi:glycoside hydrolase family 3 N-terminal domain-containing protein [Candidatus Colwellia aromaticivorans]|uniref:glycoside hydrolase family 3 N-terminal domain-containing protein n=1 Tax=Candidatus Colwellia aromaticivorans TaxID=2267621 RepID=UPI0014438E29|nr:glycoside hydrolase family 3 protein [Candidatus Colwellia aromaticivorans]